MLLQREPDPVSAECIARAQYHYDPSRDVVARGEFLPEVQFKVGHGAKRFSTGLHPL